MKSIIVFFSLTSIQKRVTEFLIRVKRHLESLIKKYIECHDANHACIFCFVFLVWHIGLFNKKISVLNINLHYHEHLVLCKTMYAS